MKVLSDSHKLIYDTVIVFPPDNVRQVSNAREFTLTPGNYTYPFEFKLPLNNSCIQMSGITNKISFNKKNFDLMINNGNFNLKTVTNSALAYGNGNGKPQNYHVTTQLPPSLSGMDDFASIKYFVKVTCKRSSFLKVNLRSFDPFVFLPLDLDDHNNPISTDLEEYREVFVRKELIFRDRIPEIVGIKLPPQATNKKALPRAPVNYQPQQKKGFFQKLFEPANVQQNEHPNPPPPPKRISSQSYYPEISSKDVPFSFEVRFRHPAFLIPTKKPSFRLYLVSKLKPSRYSLAEYGKPQESNGLGVVYLQKLKLDLTSITTVSVVEDDGFSREIHNGSHEEVTNVCNNMYENLKFDLMAGKLLKSAQTSNATSSSDQYELEIPTKYFNNAILAEHLAPSFRTCNISRRYKLTIVAGFSCEKIIDFKNTAELNKKIKYVDLECPNIKVLSGLNMTSTLHSNASKSSISFSDRKDSFGTNNPPRRDSQLSSSNPPMPPRPFVEKGDHNGSIASEEDVSGGELPTYDDVMLESNFQDDSEHQRARRRYQQHSMYYQNLDT